jgi:hypothetical protein
MDETQLTPNEAAATVGVLLGAATRRDESLTSAVDKLTRLAGEGSQHGLGASDVGLVVLNGGGVPEVVAGQVALVDFHELADDNYEPTEFDRIADELESALDERAKSTVGDLRSLARARRAQRRERAEQTEIAGLTQRSQRRRPPATARTTSQATHERVLEPRKVAAMAARELGMGLMRGHRATHKKGYSWENALEAVTICNELTALHKQDVANFLRGFAVGLRQEAADLSDHNSAYREGVAAGREEDERRTLPA